MEVLLHCSDLPALRLRLVEMLEAVEYPHIVKRAVTGDHAPVIVGALAKITPKSEGDYSVCYMSLDYRDVYGDREEVDLPTGEPSEPHPNALRVLALTADNFETEEEWDAYLAAQPEPVVEEVITPEPYVPFIEAAGLTLLAAGHNKGGDQCPYHLVQQDPIALALYETCYPPIVDEETGDVSFNHGPVLACKK